MIDKVYASFSESTENQTETEQTLWEIRKNEKKPISRQRHPHIHFREIDRLMYPLKSPHPSPHHLSPVFNEAFRSNITPLKNQESEKLAKNGSDYMIGNESNTTTSNLEDILIQPKSNESSQSLEDSLSQLNLNGSVSKKQLQDALNDFLKKEDEKEKEA